MKKTNMMEGAPSSGNGSSRNGDDGDDTSVGGGSHAGGVAVVNDVNRDQTEAIANRENKILFGMRLIVMAVLVCSTCLLAYFVHDYLKTTEVDEFHKEFESDAAKILQSVGSSLDLTLGSVDALTVAMVSHAKATNQSWPFVSKSHVKAHVCCAVGAP